MAEVAVAAASAESEIPPPPKEAPKGFMCYVPPPPPPDDEEKPYGETITVDDVRAANEFPYHVASPPVTVNLDALAKGEETAREGEPAYLMPERPARAPPHSGNPLDPTFPRPPSEGSLGTYFVTSLKDEPVPTEAGARGERVSRYEHEGVPLSNALQRPAVHLVPSR